MRQHKVLAFVAIALLAIPANAQTTNWIGAGAGYNSAASPSVNGWASYATLLSKTQLLYSFSSYDVVPLKVNGKYTIQTSTRTGFALVVRNIGPITVLGLGDAGIAASSVKTGSAFSGGGIAVWRLGKTLWTLEAAVRRLQTSLPQSVYEIGFGRGW